MSWGTCYSGSNNIHYNFPPIMTDGRIFSSWQPEAVINENIQNQENIHSNWNYRQYMTHNGLHIMKYNNLEACNLLGLPTHFKSNELPSDAVSQNPHLYKSTYIKNVCFQIYEIKGLKYNNGIINGINNDNNYPIIIYKNNDIIKQIFYENNNIFLMNHFMIRQPHH